MSRVRSTFLTVAVISLTATWLAADENTEVLEPLQVLENCIKAAEAGDFAGYVDHLSKDEQELQAGYILQMTKQISSSSSLDRGAAIADPTLFLMMRTLSDLVKEHTKPPTHLDPSKAFARGLSTQPAPYPAASYPSQVRSLEAYRKGVHVLDDTRRFLIAALAELTRPTLVSGEEVPEPDSFVKIGENIKLAKTLKWTLYTRGDYALAMAIKPKTEEHTGPTGAPLLHVEFKRISGRWLIVRLLPATGVKLMSRMAINNPFTPR